MSLIATLALAASAGATLPQCSWDRPGANPFMGDVVAAVDRYRDIPAATREKLKARMQARQYDDLVLIERDGIRGQARYAPEIRDMHFGAGAICTTVTRTKWTPQTQERGLVYCEDGQCILVPTVCRNVSRIRRLDQPAAIAPSQAANVASATREGADATPLDFDPPGAGPMAAGAPADSFAGQSGTASLAQAAPTAGGSFASLGGDAAAAAPAGGAGPQLVGMGIPALPPGTLRATDALPGVTPSVPEPGTWALLIAGLALLGWRTRELRR